MNTILTFDCNGASIDLSKVYLVGPKKNMEYEIWIVGCSEPIVIYDEFWNEEYLYMKRNKFIEHWMKIKK